MPLRSTFTRFFQLEAASGLLLIAAAALALIINNSPLSHYYTAFLDVPVAVQIGALQIAKPSLLWINDGLMALFFLLIGLEVKRELLEGQLSKPSQVVLPGAAAIGGMVVPALIYWYINKDYPDALAHDFHGLQPHQLHVSYTVLADDAFKLLKAMTDTANQLAAIAPAGAPADLVRFQQDHAHAALGQLQGRVQAGKATAHHTHIRHQLALQHRVIGLRQAAGGVIRSGVLAALNWGVHVRNPDY